MSQPGSGRPTIAAAEWTAARVHGAVQRRRRVALGVRPTSPRWTALRAPGGPRLPLTVRCQLGARCPLRVYAPLALRGPHLRSHHRYPLAFVHITYVMA